MTSTRAEHLEESASELFYESRVISVSGISVLADALDYIAAPIFSLPVVGDIADVIIAGLLYRITKSKVNIVINAVEFVPFVGDFIPTYTISTLLWILNESRKRNNHDQPTIRRKDKSLSGILKSSNADITERDQHGGLRVRMMRYIAILKNRTK